MRIRYITPPYVASLEATVADGLVALGHELVSGRDYALNYAEADDGDPVDLWIKADTDNYDLMAMDSDVPCIALHGHDRFLNYQTAPDSSIKTIEFAHWKADVAFIRDMDRGMVARTDIPLYPLDYGVERRYVEACKSQPETRKNELVFFGSLGTARREFHLKAVERAGLPIRYGSYEFRDQDPRWEKWVYGRYTHSNAYYHELTQYRFAFCPVGAGVSCFRHAEAFAAGCIPVIQRYPEDIIPYHRFVDGENCILWAGPDELVSKLSYWMGRPEEAEQLRLRAYAYGQHYMSSASIATYVLSLLEPKGIIKE